MSISRAHLVVSLGLLLGAPLAAQAPEDYGRTRIQGRILDLETSAPLRGAFVAPQGLLTGFLTDSLGNFVLDLPSQPVFYLHAEQLGYEAADLRVSSAEAGRPIEVKLRPKPIVLEGVTALIDRFERRRSFFDGSIRVYDRDRLLAVPQMDALQFVSSRTGLVRQCQRDPLNYCVWRRGRLAPISVCIDEMQSFQGARELEQYSPQDFYLVEVYDHGSHVRVYTNGYVEQTVERGRPLRPLIMGC